MHVPALNILIAQAGPLTPQMPALTDSDPWPVRLAAMIAVAAIGAVYGMYNRQRVEIKEITDKAAATIEKITSEFKVALSLKDDQILNQGKRFEETAKSINDQNHAQIREMRDEHRETVKQLFKLSADQVSAMEHVTSAVAEMKESSKNTQAALSKVETTMQKMETTLNQVVARLEAERDASSRKSPGKGNSGGSTT